MSDLILARNCSDARMLPGEAELVSEGGGQSVKRSERSNGPAILRYIKKLSFLIK